MLKHPWLDMTDNYDFKYSDREYEVMMLKKDLKKGGQKDDGIEDDKQEMNELIDSDPELYGGDAEDMPKPRRRNDQKERLR